MKTKIFQYNGNNITFNLGNSDVMLNATQMAKNFNKMPADWFRLKSSKNFIDALSTVKHIPITELIQVIQGGNSKQGTWMHEDVAMEFARWLSPEFSIWCNDRIKELMKYGFTATPQTLEDIANNPELIIQLGKNLKKERQEKERLQLEIETKHKPRSQFIDKVFESDDLISMSVVAKTLQLSFGRNTLYKKLREKGVLFKNSNEPKQPYVERGYFKLKEKLITLDDGRQKITLQTFVTQKGLAYIAKIFNVIQIPLHAVQISA